MGVVVTYIVQGRVRVGGKTGSKDRGEEGREGYRGGVGWGVV